MSRKLATTIPRVSLTPDEAAASLGVGPTYFADHVRPELRLVRRGRKVLVPLTELERWIEHNAHSVFADLRPDSPNETQEDQWQT
jgi:excisionase family DNA binding protein